jgi:hexosaminidase
MKKKTHGLTQEISSQQVLSFAREHFVTVIPVIETPGHILAALAAYPEPLGPTYETYGTWPMVMWGWGRNL